MKIAFIIYDLSMGGAERVVSILSRELSKNHEITILTFDKNITYSIGGKHINLNIPSSPNYFFKLLNILKRMIKLKKIFKDSHFDKIFAFMSGAYIPTILTGVECFPSVRQNPNRWGKWQFTNQLILNRKNVKKIIVPSKSIEIILSKYFKNIITIYNPIELRRIKELSCQKVEFENYIVSIGRLHKIKRFDLLIKVFKESILYTKGMKLIILGEGNERKKLEKLIKKERLEENVILYGNVNNIYSFLRKAEIFILMSQSESFGNVFIESLAVSTPVISTNVGIVSELIKDNHNGFIFKDDYVNELNNFSLIADNLKSNIDESIVQFDSSAIAKEYQNV